MYKFIHIYIFFFKFKVAAEKKYSALSPWIKDIVRHFWYCAEKCDGSRAAFLVITC